jgi:glutamate-1-semialdehyde 2,1-aminomutase
MSPSGRTTDLSSHHFERAKQCLAGGVGSAARLSLMPLFAESGVGSHLRDVDGNEYIDYALAYGPLILGHAHPVVVEAIKEQAGKGTMFGVGFESEYLLAEEIVDIVPWWLNSCDMVSLMSISDAHFLRQAFLPG